MNTDIQALLSATVFRPFEIKLKTGRVFLIKNRDYAWVRPISWTVHIVDQDERLYIIAPSEIDHVSTVEEAVTEQE